MFCVLGCKKILLNYSLTLRVAPWDFFKEHSSSPSSSSSFSSSIVFSQCKSIPTELLLVPREVQ